MPARIRNKEGKAIQGTLGFTGALLKIVRRVSPTHLLVLFDGEHPGGRAELNPAYKANRVDYTAVPDDDNPFSQLPDIVAALDFMGIRHAETTDGETDDAIAGYVGRYRGRIPIVISSLDSDFFQLIGKTVTVLRYRGEHTVLCDTAYVLDRFGISPASLPISRPSSAIRRTTSRAPTVSVPRPRLRCSIASAVWRRFCRTRTPSGRRRSGPLSRRARTACG